jgi:hypothetical protein
VTEPHPDDDGSTRTDRFCEAGYLLTESLRHDVRKLDDRVTPYRIVDEIICHLAEHDDTVDHFAIVYDHLPGHDSGAIWTRWNQEPPTTVFLLPDCTSCSPGIGKPCGLFAAHPGNHTWEIGG